MHRFVAATFVPYARDIANMGFHVWPCDRLSSPLIKGLICESKRAGNIRVRDGKHTRTFQILKISDPKRLGNTVDMRNQSKS